MTSHRDTGFRRGRLRARRGALAAVALLAICSAGRAQQSQPAGELDKLVAAGQLESLESRLRGDTSPAALRLLAHASANKAAKMHEERLRDRGFEEALRRFERWIDALARSNEEAAVRTVETAAARLELGAMILARQVGPELDEHEISLGLRGDAARMAPMLERARKQFAESYGLVAPLAKQLETADAATEEKFLLLGVLEEISRVRLDARFNLGWACVYAASVGNDAAARKELLRTAETSFRDLVATGQPGETAARCQLGLAMTLREQGRVDEAARLLETAQREAAGLPVEAQVRCERARNEIAGGRFEEARGVLKPLLALDPENLPAEQRSIRYYVNLAAIREAQSYLVESDRLKAQASASTAKEAILTRAQRVREIGLSRLSALSDRGGPWPSLVQGLLAANLKDEPDFRNLTPIELLITARKLAEEKRYPAAVLRLEEAAKRVGVPPAVAGDVLFELGECHYRAGQARPAAQAFDRLVRELPEHSRSAQAATLAYQLWATTADESKSADDYQRLADDLLLLLQRYPRHEKRDEAAWFLPVALQASRKYAEAAQHFGAIPAAHAKWEEAQYRRALCARLALERDRAGVSADAAAAQSLRVASDLLSYARGAETRLESARDKDDTRRWIGLARVNAAELYAHDAVAQFRTALESIDGVERFDSSGELTGRALATRIIALRGLQRFEEAAAVVEQFLRSVPAEQAAAVLSSLARGLQDELDRLEASGDETGAAALAVASIATFEQLDVWSRAQPDRARFAGAIRYSLARVRYLAGKLDAAQETVDALAAEQPENGEYQRLRARVSFARLRPDATPAEVMPVREAWGRLLRDPELRKSRPDQFWEARYHFLALLLREGRTDEVRRAIEQERVWSVDLGGPKWRPRLEALLKQCAVSDRAP